MSLTTAAQLATLRTELATDPRGYGYAALVQAANDQGVADMLNLLRDGTAGRVPTTPTGAGGLASGIINVRRNDISGAEIIQAVDPVGDQSTNTTNLQGLFFNACCSMRLLSFVNSDGSDNLVLKNLKQCFGSGSASRTALGNLSKRVGSRGEELFVAGTSITTDDVGNAR